MTTQRFVNGLTIARRVMRLVPVDWEPANDFPDVSDDSYTLAEIYNALYGPTWDTSKHPIDRIEDHG